MKNIAVIAIIAIVLYFVFAPSDQGAAAGVDLNRVLDITADTLTRYDQQAVTDDQKAESVEGFREELQTAYNTARPPLSSQPMGVSLRKDGAIVGFADPNGNTTKDAGEQQLFTVEIDSEKERLIATDTAGQSQGHGFSMGGMLTGFILGSMLSRQTSAGVRPSSLSNRTMTSRNAYSASRASASSSARSRSGSGSHRTGK